jgi:hypothetical protein
VDFVEKIQSGEKRKPGSLAKVFSTSEFNNVKARLMAMHNRRKPAHSDPNKPRLRRGPGGNTGTIDDGSGDDKKAPADQDERPTLKAPSVTTTFAPVRLRARAGHTRQAPETAHVTVEQVTHPFIDALVQQEPLQTCDRPRSLHSWRTCTASSRLTVGNPSRKTSNESPHSR